MRGGSTGIDCGLKAGLLAGVVGSALVGCVGRAGAVCCTALAASGPERVCCVFNGSGAEIPDCCVALAAGRAGSPGAAVGVQMK